MPAARTRTIVRRMKVSIRPAAVALGLVVALAACSTTPPPSPSAVDQPTPGPESPVASPSTQPPSATPLPSIVIEPASVPGSNPASATVDIVPGGDGLVAIGFDGAFGSILWTSEDGTTWRDVTPGSFVSVGMADVLRTTDGGLVAVGRGDTINVDAEAAAAYLSEDGLAWRQVTDSPGLRGQLIRAIEASDGTIVAVGGVPGEDAAGFWRSPDAGETWERVGDDLPGSFLWSIAEGGPGFVAVGWRRTPDPTAAVWTSPDGGTWTLVPGQQAPPGTELVDVLALEGGGLVAVGSAFDGSGAFILHSDDGFGWTAAAVEGDLGGAGLRDVVETPIGLVAVGGSGTDAVAWHSTDAGRTWSLLADPVPDAYFTSASVIDGGLVLTGATQTGTLETGIDSRAAAWTVSLPD
jgi:photosystem II stability/assembly factor-like uncharacterized protein